jgi:hypothetical protein
MPRDPRTVAKYVIAGFGLVAMLALAPYFFASGLMAPGWAVGVFILARTLRARLHLDQAEAAVGGTTADHCRGILARRHECRCRVARLDTVTLRPTMPYS